MKARISLAVVVAMLFAMLGTTLQAAAQDLPRQRDKNDHRYKLIDITTFGGPHSSPAFPNLEIFPVRSLNNRGTFVGQADTSTPDPFPNFCFNEDCLVSHAFRWQNGVMTDLGALTTGVSSNSAWVANSDLVAGVSENGEIDPLIPGFPELHAVLWKHKEITDLGTMEGGNESLASAVNSRGQVVGLALNNIPDVNSMVGAGYQTRAFLWQDGVMQDLGTLSGGTDAVAVAVNDRGQIMGQSYTADSTPPPTPFCAVFPLTQHGFLWENGRMLDVGTLGGSCTFTYGLNSRGQIVGQSAVAEDATLHPFLWSHGMMTDLGTLGGTYGFANWINDPGTVVGTVTNQGDQALLAFLWKDGMISNLGTLPGNACSAADAINSKGQVVGGSGFNDANFFPACTDLVEHAFLWENGTMLDLNAFVPPGSDLTLNEAVFINPSGEIGGFASLPNGDTHAFVLIPCGARDMDGCRDAASGTSATRVAQGSPEQRSMNMNRSYAVRRLLQHRPGFERLIGIPRQ